MVNKGSRPSTSPCTRYQGSQSREGGGQRAAVVASARHSESPGVIITPMLPQGDLSHSMSHNPLTLVALWTLPRESGPVKRPVSQQRLAGL